jgi:hypothetical protein
MFTVLRIETLDTWDQILYVAMFGCEGYPAGYEFVSADMNLSCENSHPFGWSAAIVFTVVTIIGAFVMPTVLIGVVSIKFDETTSRFQLSKAKKKEFNIHLAHAQVIAHTHTHTQDAHLVLVFVCFTLLSRFALSLSLNERMKETVFMNANANETNFTYFIY